MAASPAGVPGATLRFRKLGVEQKSRETGPLDDVQLCGSAKHASSN